MTMLRLTDYETGAPIYVRREAIQSARQLCAEVVEPVGDDDVAQEEGDRTRIDTATDMFLVREPVDYVMGMGNCSTMN